MSAPLDERFQTVAGEWTGDLVGDVASQTLDATGLPPRRTWFGWSATSLPVAPLLLLGVFLGPHGLFILTPSALAIVDPALPVAFATLGALIGLMPGMHPPSRRALAGATLSVMLTTTVVALGFGVGATLGGAFTEGFWLLPLALGTAAASSLIVPMGRPSPRGLSAAGPEGEAVISVLTGGLLIAFARQGGYLTTFIWLTQVCAVVAMLGLAGWLLLRHSVASAERRVFAVATLLLVGGAADALSSSALLGGLCAGVLWNLCGGPSRDSLHRDMLYALHPLIALVLVVAGARVELSTATLGMAAGYACLRTLARLGSATLLVRLEPDVAHVARLAPGIFGVAFVLTAYRALGPDLTSAVSVVVIGTVLSEVTALVLAPKGDAE